MGVGDGAVHGDRAVDGNEEWMGIGMGLWIGL